MGGGAGMGGGGMGGAGGAGGAGGGPTGTLVAMAGPSSGGAKFEPAAGWTSVPLSFSFHSADIAPQMAGGALAVMRRSSGVPAENNELFWTTWSKASGFTTPQQVGTFGFAMDGPATAQIGVASVMTFLGTDNKHYYAQNGMVQNPAFGPSATVLASNGTVVYAVYAGDNGQIYFSAKWGPGSVWDPSSQAPTSTVANTIRPFAFVDSESSLRIVYVRQSDNRICMVKRITPQNSWTNEEAIASATTSKQPSAVEVTPQGDIIVAYHGMMNEGIYFARGKDGAFGSITTVDVPAGTSSAPVVVKGLSGADAEILYAAGDKLRHGRINGNSVAVADVPGLTGVATATATIVP
jgi:hypothetical protein